LHGIAGYYIDRLGVFCIVVGAFSILVPFFNHRLILSLLYIVSPPPPIPFLNWWFGIVRIPGFLHLHKIPLIPLFSVLSYAVHAVALLDFGMDASAIWIA
jgi:hypothetical protein